jgi:hypothetical protein
MIILELYIAIVTIFLIVVALEKKHNRELLKEILEREF